LSDTSTMNGRPSTHAACYDGNGNVIALVNFSDASLTARYEYGPFGEPIRQTGPMAEATPFRFSTKFTDNETGHLYCGYRYYLPSVGRWASRDAIGEDGGMNTYAILAGNPITEVDASGLCLSTWIGKPGYCFDPPGTSDDYYTIPEAWKLFFHLFFGDHDKDYQLSDAVIKVAQSAFNQASYIPNVRKAARCNNGGHVAIPIDESQFAIDPRTRGPHIGNWHLTGTAFITWDCGEERHGTGGMKCCCQCRAVGRVDAHITKWFTFRQKGYNPDNTRPFWRFCNGLGSLTQFCIQGDASNEGPRFVVSADFTIDFNQPFRLCKDE
jgi:RHS repeat-associated protein